MTIRRIPGLRRRQDRSSPLEQIIFSVCFLDHEPDPAFQTACHPGVFGVPSGATAWLIKKLYDIPYIVSLRGGDVPGFRPYDFQVYHRLVAPFLRVIWRNAAAVVANSGGLRPAGTSL